jgi:predicted membrane metal-binding protein
MSGRDATDAHPINAISGLRSILDSLTADNEVAKAFVASCLAAGPELQSGATLLTALNNLKATDTVLLASISGQDITITGMLNSLVQHNTTLTDTQFLRVQEARYNG